ncbi:MAG: ACR3 family arsenite efflux transporter [Chloroherpetonaceae bacterium]|nr:ACR3 family arsenite efflux transporter [Chloroherpetonaceae bacterium]
MNLPEQASQLKRLSTLDRFLPLWILLAMGAGLLLSQSFPSTPRALESVQIEGVSLPIAIGLLVMMYPPLAKVRYHMLSGFVTKWRLFQVSLFLNWIVGPILMTALAWIFFPNETEFRNGLILVGLARCIAMVLVWNSLACGSSEIAAILVALNSIFQILTYSLFGWFFMSVLPMWVGSESAALSISIWSIAKSVLVFLGIPFLLGFLSRFLFTQWKGEAWVESQFLPFISPFALLGLLYTIVLIFAMQGNTLLSKPIAVVSIAVPLLLYFVLMFSLSFWLSYVTKHTYEESASIAFTASGNNFELAIAVAIGTFGITSGEALAATVGPLVEVPALVSLVYLSLWFQRRFYSN